MNDNNDPQEIGLQENKTQVVLPQANYVSKKLKRFIAWATVMYAIFLSASIVLALYLAISSIYLFFDNGVGGVLFAIYNFIFGGLALILLIVSTRKWQKLRVGLKERRYDVRDTAKCTASFVDKFGLGIIAAWSVIAFMFWFWNGVAAAISGDPALQVLEIMIAISIPVVIVIVVCLFILPAARLQDYLMSNEAKGIFTNV